MKNPVVIVGGAGFVGTNLAAQLAEQGESVRIFDNLSRAGVEQNLYWLQSRFGQRIEFTLGDVRNQAAVQAALTNAGSVFHFAAQVAVTASLADPLLDFDVNALGTLHVLEAVRQKRHQPPVVFTSTNKVYGCLPQVALREDATRYVPQASGNAEHGVSETEPLDFHSPYGCSKGAADQYVRDYARCFGLTTVVLRMSCIYGPHQAGNEDQGWVAHFCRSALEQRPTVVFGDGKQVRDILYVSDLVEALLLARQRASELSGRAFNIGGGPRNCLSLQELIAWLEHRLGRSLSVRHDTWRAGDQRYYASDTQAFRLATGWQPSTNPTVGLESLLNWLQGRRHSELMAKRPWALASAALASTKAGGT